MFEWFIEVILILMILVQYYFSKKRAELEPSESNETSRDIVVCKTGKIWHYKDYGHLKHTSEHVVCKMCKDCQKKHKGD